MRPTLPMPLCSTEFFSFSRRPFRGTPDLEDYVAIDAIDQEVQRLAAAATHGDGIAVLTAVPGAGKTLVCQRLQAAVGECFEAVLLSSSGFATRRALLQAVLFALGQSYKGSSEQELRLSVLNYARTLAATRDGIVLIIDEAHLLNVRLLEELRCLTNHSQGGQPLIRVVLCGQLPLEDTLVDPALEALNYRITCHATLEPLSMQESAQLIAGRLRRAGRAVKEVFTPEALETICRVSDGNPRCLVQLCDESLRIAAGSDEAPVEVQTVRRALYGLKQLPLQWNESAIDQLQSVAALSDATVAANDAPAPSMDDAETSAGGSAGSDSSATGGTASEAPAAISEAGGGEDDLCWSDAVSSVELGADCELGQSLPTSAGWSSFEPHSGWVPGGADDAPPVDGDPGVCDPVVSSCGLYDGMAFARPLPDVKGCSWSDSMTDRRGENAALADSAIADSAIAGRAIAAEARSAAESDGKMFVELPVEDVYAALDAQKPRTSPPCESGDLEPALRSAVTEAAGEPRRSMREPIADAEPCGKREVVADEQHQSGDPAMNPVQRLDAVMAALSEVSAESDGEPKSSRGQWQSAGDCRDFDVLDPGGEPQWDQDSAALSAEASSTKAGLQARAPAHRSDAARNAQNGSVCAPVRRPYARLFSRVRRQQS
jgi:type II secretory pathway predicted ATPase ExeA